MLTERIASRFDADRQELPVSVTDLLALRPAFYRRRGAVPPADPARQQRLEAGRRWHSRIADRLPGEGSFEVRVRRGEITGRIDLWADVPVEVKSSSGRSGDPPGFPRDEHLEQLAVYCALTDRPAGRLVVLSESADEPVSVRAWDVPVRASADVEVELGRRVESLRRALRDSSPASLARCRWYERGCEFRAGGLCTCTGDERVESSALRESVGTPTDRTDIADRWGRALRDPDGPAESVAVDRFRDLIYPRRAYFERTEPHAEVVAVPRPTRVGPELYDRLLDAVERGPTGEVARLPVRPGYAAEDVAGLAGEPFLLRTSRAWSRLRPEEIVDRFPQYALELGFRCAATGTDSGTAVIGYDRAEAPRDRLQVLRFRFDPRSAWESEWSDRRTFLERAVAERRPEMLAPCPTWMRTDCPYRPGCGCEAAGGRDQR